MGGGKAANGKDKDKAKDKDKKPELKKPLVKMIVIQKEAADPAGPDRKKGKEK